MTNEEVRKSLFQIINKFMCQKQTANDIQTLAEILIYHTPYKNSVISHVSKEELKINVNYYKDANCMAEYINSKKEIVIYNKRIHSLIDFLDTISHEYTHFLQHNLLLNSQMDPYMKLSKRLEAILSSLESFPTTKNLTTFIDYFDKTKSINNIFYENMIGLNAEKNGYAYWQLPHEVNARDSGHKFTKQFLNFLKQDRLCTHQIFDYLTKCEEELNKQWESDLSKRKSETYCKMRKEMIFAIKKAQALEIEEIEKIKSNSIKCKLFAAKVPVLRRAKIDKEKLGFLILKFNGGQTQASTRYYLQGIDQKKVVVNYLLNDKQRSTFLNVILGKVNFLNLEEEVEILSIQEIRDICIEVLRQFDFQAIFDLLDTINHIYNTVFYDYLPPQCTDRKRMTDIKKALLGDEEFVNLVNMLYQQFNQGDLDYRNFDLTKSDMRALYHIHVMSDNYQYKQSEKIRQI